MVTQTSVSCYMLVLCDVLDLSAVCRRETDGKTFPACFYFILVIFLSTQDFFSQSNYVFYIKSCFIFISIYSNVFSHVPLVFSSV